MILSTFQFSIVLYWHGRCAEKKVDEQIFYVNILPFPQAGLNSGFRVWKVTFKTQLPMPSKILFGHIAMDHTSGCHPGMTVWRACVIPNNVRDLSPK